MTGRLLAAIAVTALTLATASSVAHAEPRSEKAATEQRAKDLFAKGDAAYAEGKYEEALAAFQESYDLSGRPQLLFNISNAAERLGKLQEAADALEKYLASGKAKDREIVQKRLASLKERLDKQKKEQDEVARKEEERKREDEERQKRAEQERKKNERRTPEAPPEKPAPVLAYALIGTGSALLVTGGVFGILTLGARGEAKDGCKGALCSSSAADALDREKTFGLVADIGMASGIVLGAVGVYFLLKPSAEPKVDVKAASTARPSLYAGPEGGGVRVGGSF
jgi:tetratricopeptide (TPR) repeat protein